MSRGDGILLVTKEQETAQAVTGTLQQAERLAMGAVLPSLADLTARLEVEPALAALIDVDPHPTRMLAELELIISRFSETRFVLLSSQLREELILEAMQIGARQVVRKESVPTQLAGVLQRLTANGSGNRWGRGTVITVLSASGGCGATTIAFNLANELCLEGPETSLLIDLDRCYGAMAIYLGLRGQYGIADVLGHGSNVDGDLVSSTASVYTERLHVLLSPASVDFTSPAELHYENIRNVLDACRHAYAYTVIDAARVPMDVAGSLAANSRATLIVLQMTVKDVQVARSMRATLIERGVLGSRIFTVLNRHRKRKQMITLKECREALGLKQLYLIGNDFRSAVRGVNYGQPLAQAAPRSSLRADVRALAERLVLPITAGAER